MQIVLMIVVAILVFGLVIFVHELGHFIAAKRSGITVNEFALGMGPTLVKFEKNGTKYALRLFPIGGFVSMEGENEESSDEGSFQSASIGKRLIVTIFGAVMNIVLGFLALVVLVVAGGEIASNTVSNVYNTNSGLKVRDQILQVNGRRVFIMNDMFYEFARTQNGTFDLLIKRDGEKMLLEDVTFDTVKAVDEKTGEPVMNDATGEQYEYMDVGFSVLPVEKNFFTVTKEAFMNTLSYGRLIYLSLLDLVTGHIPVNQLSGPVGIVSELGRALNIGWTSVVQILALISINLGIVNMLPLPALDGGRALLLIVEAIRRKPIRQKYEIAINMAGFAVLMCLMVFVSFNDILRLVR